MSELERQVLKVVSGASGDMNRRQIKHSLSARSIPGDPASVDAAVDLLLWRCHLQRNGDRNPSTYRLTTGGRQALSEPKGETDAAARD